VGGDVILLTHVGVDAALKQVIRMGSTTVRGVRLPSPR